MPRRCVLLFARAPREEVRVKGLRAAETLFDHTHQGLRSAVAALPGVVLLRARQAGVGFRERLENALADAGARGYEEVVTVAGDVPGLGADHLAEAFEALGRGRLVLGPCPDGGVYLIALRLPVGDRLEGVRWRTRFVLSDLQQSPPCLRALLPASPDERSLAVFRLPRRKTCPATTFPRTSPASATWRRAPPACTTSS